MCQSEECPFSNTVQPSGSLCTTFWIWYTFKHMQWCFSESVLFLSIYMQLLCGLHIVQPILSLSSLTRRQSWHLLLSKNLHWLRKIKNKFCCYWNCGMLVHDMLCLLLVSKCPNMLHFMAFFAFCLVQFKWIWRRYRQENFICSIKWYFSALAMKTEELSKWFNFYRTCTYCSTNLLLWVTTL